MKNAMEIKEMELNEVNGGTFTPNMFEEKDYHRIGIRTKYHWFSCDEFWLPDGTKTNEAGANAYMKLQDPIHYADVERKMKEDEENWEIMYAKG